MTTAPCRTAIVAIVLPAACGNATTRHLPVASAIIVHACAAAEADAYIRGDGDPATGSPYAVKLTITVEASSSLGGTFSKGADVTAERGAEKTVAAELTRLPTMAQCQRWGYERQLGPNGCLFKSTLPGGDKCPAATEKDPWPTDVKVAPSADAGEK